jgi:CMP-N,N'-diacetyllegionaminic acid synthase
MKYLITICARSGSQGVPDKNIKLINGIPLLAYAIKLANRVKKSLNADVGFSTDSERYKEIASEYGLKTDYLRPANMATNNAGKLGVIEDLMHYMEKQNNCKYDAVIELEVTSPLRNSKEATEIFESKPEALVLYGATLSTKNPYYNLVEKNKEGYYELCIKKEGDYLTRQSAPKVYESNGMLYIFRRKFFEMNYKMFFTNRTLIYEPKHICFDIDTVTDFEFINYLISNNKLDFNIEE